MELVRNCGGAAGAELGVLRMLAYLLIVNPAADALGRGIGGDGDGDTREGFARETLALAIYHLDGGNDEVAGKGQGGDFLKVCTRGLTHIEGDAGLQGLADGLFRTGGL